MINKDSELYNGLTASMEENIKATAGGRNTNILYTLEAKSDNYIGNIMFSPQTFFMSSRILVAKHKAKKASTDLVLITNLKGTEFEDIHFQALQPKNEEMFERLLLENTFAVNASDPKDWAYTISVHKLIKIMRSTTKYDRALRSLNVSYAKHPSKTTIIDTIVKSLGYDQARNLIPQAYVCTPMANLWFNSLRSLKDLMDQRDLSGRLKTMNFWHKQKKLKGYEK